MRIDTKQIEFNGQQLTLTNQRVIYWEAENALILSDVHIGKTAHFRRHGIPMPDDILQNDLDRLKQLICHFKAEKLIIVGDLFHAGANIDLETFKQWLVQFFNLKIVLIKGNHDRLSKQIISNFNFQIENKLEFNGLTFIHDSIHDDNLFVISGHTHPGVLIKAKGKQRLKLPCFQVTDNQIILPAFSLFTGLNTINKPDDCCYYAFTNESIFEIKTDS